MTPTKLNQAKQKYMYFPNKLKQKFIPQILSFRTFQIHLKFAYEIASYCPKTQKSVNKNHSKNKTTTSTRKPETPQIKKLTKFILRFNTYQLSKIRVL